MSRLTQPLPKILVLDLDWTVWKGDCGVNFFEPFTKSDSDFVWDKYSRRIRLFPEVKAIIAEFHAAGVKIAFASRNQGHGRCRQLLEAFDLWTYAEVFLAMSSGSSNNKDPHFKIIQERTGIEYKDMLFVDDLPQNIDGAREMGVVAVLCDHMTGLCWQKIDVGLAEYQTRECGFPSQAVAPVEQWVRHEKWTKVCDTLANVNYHQVRKDWWNLVYGCDPSRMCAHNCVSLTDCYHGKLI